MPSSVTERVPRKTRPRRSPDPFSPINLLAPLPPPPSSSAPQAEALPDTAPSEPLNHPLGIFSSSPQSIGTSVVFAQGRQQAMVVPEQGQPPLLLLRPQEDTSPRDGGVRAAAAGGNGVEQSIMFGPGGEETVGDLTPSPQSPPSTAPPATANPEEKPTSQPDSSTPPTPTTVQVPATVESPPHSNAQQPQATSVATPSVQTTTSPPPPSNQPPPTAQTSPPTVVTLSSLLVVETSVIGSTEITSVGGSTIVSTVSAPTPSSHSHSQPSSLSASLTSSLASSPSSSSISSSSATLASSNALHRHPSAAFIILACLGSLVLVGIIATSLSWVLSYRRTGSSAFPCCGGGRRGSDTSYDSDAYSYDIAESRAGGSRRTSVETSNEKFYASGAGRLEAEDSYAAAAAGGTGVAGGFKPLDRGVSIKRGIAESELENGWDPNSQTYGGGRENKTFQDPANGRHATPSLYAGSIKSFATETTPPSAKPPLGSRNPFAIPPMMTPLTPEVTSSLSDGPYPNPRPLPGGLMVANLAPGDMTEGEDGAGVVGGFSRGEGYETEGGEMYGTPRLGDQSRPRFLSLGRDGGLELPWNLQGDQLHQDYTTTFPDASNPPLPPPSGSSSTPFPNALQPAQSTPALSTLPLHSNSYLPPPTPFPDPANEGWATTLRSNLFAAITSVTGRSTVTPPSSITGRELGIEGGLGPGVVRSGSAASAWSQESRRTEGGGGGADRFTPRVPAGIVGKRAGSRRVPVLDGVKEESSAGEQLVSPFSRTSSQNSRSTYNSPRPALQSSPSNASSIYASSTAPSDTTDAPPSPRRGGSKARRTFTRSSRGGPGAPAGGLAMETEASSEDGSTWNGLGGRSETEGVR